MADRASGNNQLESPNVRTRPVLLAALGSLVVVFGSIWLLAAFFAWQVPTYNLPPPEKFPAPRLRTDEVEQRLRIEAEQRERLTGYHWANQSRTLVRIPIERAMQIIAARGAGAYAPIAPSPEALASPTAGAQRATPPQREQLGSGAPHSPAKKPPGIEQSAPDSLPPAPSRRSRNSPPASPGADSVSTGSSIAKQPEDAKP